MSEWDQIEYLLRVGQLAKAHQAFLRSGPSVSKREYLAARNARINKSITTIQGCLKRSQYDDAAFFTGLLEEVLLPDEDESYRRWWDSQRFTAMERAVRARLARFLEDGDEVQAQLAYEIICPLDEEGELACLVSRSCTPEVVLERLREKIEPPAITSSGAPAISLLSLHDEDREEKTISQAAGSTAVITGPCEALKTERVQQVQPLAKARGQAFILEFLPGVAPGPVGQQQEVAKLH